MKFLLGTKQNMTQVYGDDGRVYPVTLISAGPIVVTQVKTTETDGYTAVQVGYGTKSPKSISKAVKGHVKGLGSFAKIVEYRMADGSTLPQVGETITASLFTKGEILEVSGTSKSKGFQGVVKRHGFHGGPRSHGQAHSEREAGSISGGLRTRVPKGMKMAGRMGGDRVTLKSVEVVAVDPVTNQMLVKGAVPGRRGTIIELKGNA